MSSTTKRLAGWAVGVALIFFSVPRTARAADFYTEGLAYGGATTWSHDPSFQAALHSGFEFLDVISVDVLGRIGYAAVDERMLMTLGIGTKLALPFDRFIPHLRLTALHAHETSISAMGNDTFGHIMGVGDGIRHRFGVEGAIGFSVVFAKLKKNRFFAQTEAYFDGFPDDRGPKFYAGGGLGLGVQVGL